MTPDLSQRIDPDDLPELIDGPCSFEQMRVCLRQIARLNRLTFAHRPTLLWLQQLIETRRKISGPLHIVDAGCGYGDGLRRIHQWAVQRGVPVTLTGIDLNADALRAAAEATPSAMEIRWVHSDVFSYHPQGPVDVMLNSLMAHHLKDAQVVQLLTWMETNARAGWLINDLHRQQRPYQTYSIMAKLLFLHPMIQHDGLVSIRRSFRFEDWERLSKMAGLPQESICIRAYRPARLCIGHIRQ